MKVARQVRRVLKEILLHLPAVKQVSPWPMRNKLTISNIFLKKKSYKYGKNIVYKFERIFNGIIQNFIKYNIILNIVYNNIFKHVKINVKL